MYEPRQPRTCIAIEVDITINGSPPTRHMTRDIGFGGVLVDPGEQALPQPETDVDINFLGLRTIPARVMRASDTGIALMFREVHAEDFTFLSALLHRSAF